VTASVALAQSQSTPSGQAPPSPPTLPQADHAVPPPQAAAEEADAAATPVSDSKPDGRKPAAAERQLPRSSARSLDEAVNRVIESERRYLENLQKFTPLVETYIQNVHRDSDLGMAPEKDHYFLGRLSLTHDGAHDQSYLPRPGLFHRMLKDFSRLYSLDFLPLGFVQMVMRTTTSSSCAVSS